MTIERIEQDQQQQDEEDKPQSEEYQVQASIRVLCLHDANSNAKELHQWLQPLDERLYYKHRIEFVYINAPLVMIEEDMATEDRKRLWWEATDDHPLVGIGEAAAFPAQRLRGPRKHRHD